MCFCPERMAEGAAMTELYELPQIVSGRNQAAAERADKVFRHLTDKVIHLSPEEAELASSSSTRGATPASPTSST